ncbi:hypothetical protein [Rubrivivax gelatinosus]|nr:hypothetical protein [Rubrivivax gelatinosus]
MKPIRIVAEPSQSRVRGRLFAALSVFAVVGAVYHSGKKPWDGWLV